MKIIKLIDYLVDKSLNEHKGEIIAYEALKEKDTIVDIMLDRLKKLETLTSSDNNFLKLSKEQEIKFIKNLIIRIESDND
jgi:hypothetical protein